VIKERWCNKCDDYVTPKWVIWESSIARVADLECPKCRKIFTRQVQKLSPPPGGEPGE